MAELEQTKFSLIDITIRFEKQFDRAQSQLEKALANVFRPGSDRLSYIDGQAIFFRTDYSYRVQQLKEARPEDVIKFDPPDDCLKVAKPELKRPRDQYFLYQGDNFIFDYSEYVSTFFAVLLTNDYSGDRERLRIALRDVIEKVVPSLCRDLNTSKEYQQFLTTIAQIDTLLDQQETIDGTRSAPRAASEATESTVKIQDAGAVALLLANRFGPLIIIFFFSSLIITLYKYNLRLVGFYYARLYALEASDAPIHDSEFMSAVRAFSPDGVDFGRMPRTPVDIAGDIAAKIVEKIDVLKEQKPK
jgi:hypothetical protein